MQRRILSTACTAAFLCITLVPAAPAWAAEKNTGAPSEAALASIAILSALVSVNAARVLRSRVGREK